MTVIDRTVSLTRTLKFTRAVKLVVVAALAVTITACSGTPQLPNIKSFNPFKKGEVKLPGERIAVMSSRDALSVDNKVTGEPVKLPSPNLNVGWTQPGGSANNSPGHLSMSSDIRQTWNLEAGKGSSKKGHLTAKPIVYNGRVYTLDTYGQVRAFSIPGGSRVWQASTTPENEKRQEGFGGGLAVDSDILIVATGYGWIYGLNPSNGSKIWSKNLGVPVRTSPTANNGKIFVTTTDGRFYSLAVADGVELWTTRGLPDNTSLLSNVSPAVSGATVVVPYAIGEIVAYDTETGKPRWSETLVRNRGGSALSGIHSPARPVIDQGVVYAVSQSGRMIATSNETGERIWTQNIRSTETPVLAGDSVFVVDITGNIIALTRQDGKIRWITALPTAQSWSGPVLAGNRLWAVSSSGELVGVEAQTGQIASKKNIKSVVHIGPIVASGRMYIYTDDARLIAFN